MNFDQGIFPINFIQFNHIKKIMDEEKRPLINLIGLKSDQASNYILN